VIDLIVDDLISCTPVYPVIVTFVYIYRCKSFTFYKVVW